MEDFVPYELAVKLKEKGFPQRPDYFNYSSYYDWDGLRKIHSLSNASVCFDPNISKDNIYFAPTISQVLKWLRDKEVYVVPTFCVDENDNGYWDFRVIDLIDGTLIYDEIKNRYDTYELAALAGIEYVIDNLI